MNLSQYPVVYQQQVAWGDMDAFGHVNNVVYYRYMESARIFYMDQLDLLSQGFNTVVAQNNCHYLSAIVYPDQLKIGVRIDEIRSSAFRMHYLLWSESQHKIVAHGEAVLVCLDKETLEKTKISEDLKQKMIALELTVNHQI